jgi:cytochrome c-type biogenesis protein CcmH
MTLFALLLAAMILVALVLLLPAFRGRDEVAVSDREQFNVRIARERLVELETARDAGELTEPAFEQARSELERALAADLAEQGEASRRGGKPLLLALIGLVPLLAVGLYLLLGAPQFLDVAGPGAGHATERVAASAQGQPPSVEAMVAKLEAKLQEAPDDPDGWYMLGRSYMTLKRYADAVRAYEKLQGLVGEHPAALVALADAVAMTQDGRMAGRPTELVDRALKVAPNDPIALWLAGQAAEERGEPRAAVELWMKALPAVAKDQAAAKELRTMIARAALAAGMTPDDLAKLHPAMPATGAGAGEPAQASAAAPGESGKSVKVKVAIAPELRAAAKPGDTVFVFARAVAGPPMPLAVGRYTVATLPDQIVLDDNSAMAPQLRISGFGQVKVQARVAKGGQPVAQPGDLQSAATVVKVGSPDTVQLVIDQKVP